jgi:hypothetical protein
MTSSELLKRETQTELLKLAYAEVEVYLKRRALWERVSPGFRACEDGARDQVTNYLIDVAIPFLETELGLPRSNLKAA